MQPPYFLAKEASPRREAMSDLLTAYRNLNHAKPLFEDRLDSFYVGRSERNDDPVSVLTTQLSAAEVPGRVILAGQRGVGKTTELFRMLHELGRADYPHAYYMDVGSTLSGEDTTPTLAHVAVELARLTENQLKGITRWEEFLNGGGRTPPPPDTSEPALLINTIVRSQYKKFKKHAILLLDGVERFEPKRLVYRLLTELGRLNCSVVVAVSLTTDFARDFSPFRDNWEPVHLPAVPLFTRDHKSADRAGWQLLKSVLERRTDPDTLDRAALRLIIPASGGIHRDLIWTAGYACLVGHQRQKIRVTEEEAEVAVKQLQLRLTPSITPADLNVLHDFMDMDRQRDVLNETFIDQVERSRIIGYHGQQGWWWDVHPLTWPLLGRADIKAPSSF
jgi:hypothetical protein